MIRSPRASALRTQTSASPISATASSIGRTRAGAPPCRGPESAPTADDTTAPQSAPVEATIRAVNVEAFRPCSAVQIQYVSIAFAARSSTSPRQALVDVDQLLQTPLAGQDREPRLEVAHVAAGPDRELAVRGGQSGLERLVDEQTPDLLERDVPDELLDVDPAVTKRAALTVWLGDLRLEGDDALEAGPDDLGVRVAHSAPSRSTSRPIPRSRAAESTSAAAAASCTATPTDLYRVSSSCDALPAFVPLTSSPSSAWTRPGSIPTSSGAPAGGGASAESRDSTTSFASATVASSTSRPEGFSPTELTCVPGSSHSRRTTGSVACVVAATTSAPRRASS